MNYLARRKSALLGSEAKPVQAAHQFIKQDTEMNI